MPGDTINPSTGAPLITTVNLTGLPTKIFFTQTVDLTTPVPLPQDVWMTVQLTNTTCVGLVLGDTALSVGISHDLFWRGAPTDKVLTFGGFPLSNFNFLVRMEGPVCDTGADISVAAVMHTVASGTRPGSTKDPLAGITVCAYDKSAGSCALVTCGGVSHQHYECIATTCPAVNCCTTAVNGQCTINLPPGDYIVISNDATKTVLPDPLGVSASDLVCAELKQKHLQQIVRASGDKVPGKTTRRTGSELLMIEPEFIVWSTAQQLYPFVYEALGDWSVTASVSPPTGFVSDYDSLSAQVYNEIEAVQFTVTEVGSDLLPTRTTFEVTHKGRREIIHSQVDIFLTPEYARSRGFDVATLRAVGLIRE